MSKELIFNKPAYLVPQPQIPAPKKELIVNIDGDPGAPGPPGPAGPKGADGGSIIDPATGLLTTEVDSVIQSQIMFPHIIDPTPHPAYDEMADLVTYFENGLA